MDDLSLERKILISVGLPLNDVIKTVEVKGNTSEHLFLFKDIESCDELISRLFEKYYTKKLPNMSDKDFSLKVPGVLGTIDAFSPNLYRVHQRKHNILQTSIRLSQIKKS